MMRLFRVGDVSAHELWDRDYDIGIFAAGYESRCTNIARHVRKDRISKRLLFGFTELAHGQARTLHSAYLRQILETSEIPVSYDSDRPIFDALHATGSSVGTETQDALRILIDYSSMSRSWFNAVLNFYKLGAGKRPVNITFVYSVGEYKDIQRDFPSGRSDFTVDELLCLPGLEGGPMRPKSTVAILGLGFEWVQPFSVIEQVEPDTTYVFNAHPGAIQEYGAVALDRNKYFIREFVKSTAHVIQIPLRSVETAYRTLTEIILPISQEANVVLIPMGPKPHVLASILVASKFREVACLYAKGSRSREISVEVTTEDDIVATQVELVPGH